jgi:putative hemolysin
MIFDLREQLKSSFKKRLYGLVAPLVDRALAMKSLRETYEKARGRYAEHPQGPTIHAWSDSVLTTMGQEYRAELPTNFQMPAKGPLVIVSNHPFGLVDPLVLAHFVSIHRPDLRLMTNLMLGSVDELEPHVIKVNTKTGKDSRRENFAPLKEAMRFLREGGALAIFPSGDVAHYRPGRGIQESPWSSHVGGLVRRTQATVLPVFFPGHNGLIFQAAGLVHKSLRTGLMMREFLGRKHAPTIMRVGQPIPFTKLKKFTDDESLTRYLRLHTLVLGKRKSADDVTSPSGGIVGEQAPVAPPVDSASMALEIEQLRTQGRVLASQSSLSVIVAEAAQIPNVLHEIGRLREITFREVGEGTGNEIDLDKFDRYYLHIILWDDQQQRVAGAYRLGRADIILKEYGAKGLYTNTLFKFKKPFLVHMADAVEMGRSFIRAEYQRNMAALPLLWRGIIVWMGRNPNYRKLFGPVSISKDYDKLSRKLIVEFLEEQRSHPELSPMVKPRKPYRFMGGRKLLKEFISTRLQDVDDCSAVISSMETDGKGLPVLLKHYLRLNGTILSFNVDKDFSSVLDGLIMVDLLDTDVRLPAKMMGDQLWTAYQAYHAAKPSPKK